MSAPRVFLTGIVVVTLAACAGPQRDPVPIEALEIAQIPNMPNVRYWGDAPPPNLLEMLQEIDAQRKASGFEGDVATLAISGGADNGAFGAGLLNAWSDLGTRPEFAVVTGVSTGALTAPFAFLGSDYDDELKSLYGGTLPPSAYFKQRPILEIFSNVSAVDSTPLLNLIREYGDQEMFDAIAREHKRGRRLLIQTAHLDAQRAVIWDLGAIAASGAPNALDVFHKALLASASVPGAFPPVLFDVVVDGKIYQEIHADGGVISQDTTLSDWQYNLKQTRRERTGASKPGDLYLIRNGTVEPEPAITEFRLRSLAGRAISTLIKMQGIGNILAA